MQQRQIREEAITHNEHQSEQNTNEDARTYAARALLDLRKWHRQQHQYTGRQRIEKFAPQGHLKPP